MDRRKLRYSLRFILYAACFFSTATLFAQKPADNPLLWKTWVNQSQNMLLSDTFRIQTFNNAKTDNWAYKVSGNAWLFSPDSVDLNNASEGMSMLISGGGEVVFDEIDYAFYSTLAVKAPFAAWRVCPGEDLFFIFGRYDANTVVANWITPEAEYTSHFQELKDYTKYAYPGFQIKYNINHLKIEVKQTETTKNGFYGIDSVYVFGDIKTFSYFEGKGNWSDTLKWSHLPPERNRQALIRGEVEVDRSITVNNIWLSDGRLSVAQGKQLHVNNMELMNNYKFVSEGALELSGKLTVHLPEFERGKWLFISFPFDVYPDGIDERLILRDENEAGSGNFYYVLTYDGIGRAERNQSAENWKVMPATKASGNDPVFEKGKGYLIAVENSPQLEAPYLFSSKAGDVPADFGRNARIEIDLPVKTAGMDAEHYGWVLCGNPFLSHLPLSWIKPNNDLDGYIYLFDGDSFQACEIGSDAIVPMHGAFFVKASKSTSIEIEYKSGSVSQDDISKSLIEFRRFAEPQAGNLLRTDKTELEKSPEISIEDGILYVQNMSSSGELLIYDMNGRLLDKYILNTGNVSIPSPLGNGYYLLFIMSGKICDSILVLIK